jgi:hypothetical protein
MTDLYTDWENARKEAAERLQIAHYEYDQLNKSNEAEHNKKLPAAITEKEKGVEDDRYNACKTKAEEKLRAAEKQYENDMKRIDLHVSGNQNMHAVGEGSVVGEHPKPYQETTTVGVPQYEGLPMGKPANDNEPRVDPPGGGGPGGGSKGGGSSGQNEPDRQSSDTAGKGMASSVSDEQIKSDFSAPPPPPPPPPPLPEEERELTR